MKWLDIQGYQTLAFGLQCTKSYSLRLSFPGGKVSPLPDQKQSAVNIKWLGNQTRGCPEIDNLLPALLRSVNSMFRKCSTGP